MTGRARKSPGRVAPLADWLRPDLGELVAYHAPDPGDLIKLNAMENPYRWPDALVDIWLAELRTVEINRYPDPDAARLKQALRETYSIPSDMGILLGNGSDELIQLISMSLRSSACVLAPRPTFVMYRHCAVTAGLKYVSVPLQAADYAIRARATLDLLARNQPAAVFLAFPNNPTGNLFERAVIDRVIEENAGPVIIDEAYAPFAQASYLNRLGEFPNLLVMRTLSKLGLAGLRLGFLVGPEPWLREIDKLRLPYNVNVLTQVSAEFGLRHYHVLEEQTGCIRGERERLHAALQATDGVTAYRSAANFILFKVLSDADLIDRRLREGGVLVKNLHGSDPLLEGCLRVTVGRPEENAAFLSALRAAL